MIDSRFGHDCWLTYLPENACEDLNRIAFTKRYGSGENVFRKHDQPKGFYGVMSGRIRVSATTHSGDELVLSSLVPGDWFGELPILDGLGRTHDTCASDDSKLMVLPIAGLTELMHRHQSIYQSLVRLLCEHCRAAYVAIDDFLLFSPKQRLAKRLILLSDVSAGAIEASQEELSQLVGISRQSVSKFLKEWVAEGAIERRYGSIRVIDRDSLESASS